MSLIENKTSINKQRSNRFIAPVEFGVLWRCRNQLHIRKKTPRGEVLRLFARRNVLFNEDSDSRLLFIRKSFDLASALL